MTTIAAIVAAFRRPASLAACLEGIRAQTLPATEVIVVVHEDDQASAALVAEHAAGWPELRLAHPRTAGTVAAYNCGLATARADLVAFVDDDAVPDPDWLERIVATYAQDARIAAVGGRDVIIENGRVLGAPRRRRFATVRPPRFGAAPASVGRIQWFGRMIANHHLGEGGPRDVDVLKGVNMSFRRKVAIAHGFDERVLGTGAQSHSELSLCLPLRRDGLRIVYDPAISVTHHPAPRHAGDLRHDMRAEAVANAAHNETLQILDYFGPLRRIVFALWGVIVGTSPAPGLVVFGRDLAAGRPPAWPRFAAAQRGRLAAWNTHLRVPRPAPATGPPAWQSRHGVQVGAPSFSAPGLIAVPPMLHRPPPGWRSRHVFGALGLRPAAAQHSIAEAQLLRRYASGAGTVVELGVAEGGSAAELRSVMAASGHLYLVDPYEPGRLRVSMPRIVARRTVNRVSNGTVTWIRSRSDEAADAWRQPVDFLFIDADHSYERASGDWRLWSPFLSRGGYVALHDSAVFPGGWTSGQDGPVRLLSEIISTGAWSVLAQSDSLTIIGRTGEAVRRNGASNLTAVAAPTGRRDSERRLRVLRVADVHRSAQSGMSGFMLSSGAELERRGHRVDYMFRDGLLPVIGNPGVRRILVPWLIAARVLGLVLLRRGPDIVEVHEPLAAVYATVARLAGGRLPACVVLSFGLEERGWRAHVTHLRAYGRTPRLISRILVPLTLLSQARIAVRGAAAVIVPSSADRDHLVDRLGVPSERVSCAFTGVDEAFLEIEPAKGAGARVLFLGSWIERKGTLELVSAWKRLSGVRPGARLTIAGTGEYEQAAAATAGLQGVDLVPRVGRAQLAALLAEHNVFVLPSYFEGLSLALLEAAAAGLACAVTAVCGSLDLFRPDDPGRDGALLIAPNDADALYRALLRLVDDDALRDELSDRARERAREFSWSRTAEQLLDGFASALARSQIFPESSPARLQLLIRSADASPESGWRHSRAARAGGDSPEA